MHKHKYGSLTKYLWCWQRASYRLFLLQDVWWCFQMSSGPAERWWMVNMRTTHRFLTFFSLSCYIKNSQHSKACFSYQHNIWELIFDMASSHHFYMMIFYRTHSRGGLIREQNSYGFRTLLTTKPANHIRKRSQWRKDYPTEVKDLRYVT